MENNKTDIMEIFSIATKHVLSTKGIRQNAIAKSLNIGTSTLNNYIKGRRQGDETTRRRIADRLGWNYEKLLELGQWILSGNQPENFYPSFVNLTKKELFESGADITLSPELPHSETKRPDYILNQNNAVFISIPKFAARLSGDHGSFQDIDLIESNMMFHKNFLMKHGNPDQMALFEVIGNSMNPFLYNGDVVLVNLSKNNFTDIIDGKAYAFRDDQTVKVKRLSFQGAKLIATSENSLLYPPYTVDTENFSLIGEVLWVGHEVN
ncbi:MAG: LexA family transcriptional regulator [Desulfocapsaceae bacterium]|nr:LexA family transcriptional regulator [Desulfocapsaceae bacterium]